MVYDLYSEREKQGQDPYEYDDIPEALRNQVFHIIKDIIEAVDTYASSLIWREFWNACCREKGMPPEDSSSEIYCQMYLKQNATEDVLDIIDIAFQFIVQKINQKKSRSLFVSYHKATNDLNSYFQRASIGYQLIEGRMMRIDSEYLHSEAVVPALSLLRSRIFETANEGFLSAHEHYRDGKYRDCITNANSAFESVMKIICEQKGWDYGRGTADDLIRILTRNDFIPNYLQQHFEQLTNTLKSALPPLRHQQGSAHGQGTEAAEPPRYMAAYALHLAATNILFLVEAFEDGNN